MMAALSIIQPGSEGAAEDVSALCKGYAVQVNYDFEPIILKPGEITTKTLDRFRTVDEEPNTIGPDGRVSTPIFRDNVRNNNILTRFCWQFVILAHDGIYKTYNVPVVAFLLSKPGEAVTGVPLFYPNRFIVLHSRASNIFETQ